MIFRRKSTKIQLDEQFTDFSIFIYLRLWLFVLLILLEDSGIDQLSVAMRQ